MRFSWREQIRIAIASGGVERGVGYTDVAIHQTGAAQIYAFQHTHNLPLSPKKKCKKINGGPGRNE
jgi:hypothetical protein